MKRGVLLFVWFIPVLLFAQQLTVKDADSQSPLGLVTVFSKDCVITAITNDEGSADVSAFEKCKHITLRRLGYKAQSLSYSDLEQLDFELLLQKSVVALDMLVVSSSRWAQANDHIPSKITAIKPKDIQFQNPQTAADLLSLSGEVYMQKSQQGGGSPMIRGFAANRLLYTVDGVRMNTAIFRSGNLQNVISLDPFAMANVEVLFGAGSLIYGSDAIGGVMSFQTKNPQLSTSKVLRGQADVRYASANNEKTEHLDLHYGGEKWAGLTSVSYSDYGDLKMGKNGPEDYLRLTSVDRIDGVDVVVNNGKGLEQIPTAYSQLNLMQKLRYQPNKQWNIDYGVHYSETSEYDRYDRHLMTKNGLPKYGEWKYGPQIWMMNVLSIENQASSLWYDKMVMRLAHQYFEESRISRNFNDPMRETRTEQVNASSFNLDFTKIHAKHQLFYGLEVVYDDVVSKGIDEDVVTNYTQVGASRYPKSQWSSYAVYVSDNISCNDQLDVTLGLRYNYFLLDATFDTSFYAFPFTDARVSNGALTGSVGAVYRPDETSLLRLNLSTAFRSPNVDDMGKVFDSEPGAVVVPNPDLQAEYSYNVELGVAKIFADVLKVEASVYYTYLNQALVRRDYRLNGQDSIMYDGEMSQVQAVQNAAYAYVWGTQIGLDYALSLGFSISAHYNFQKGEEEQDDKTMTPARHVAPAFAQVAIRYEYKKLEAELKGFFSAQRSNNDLTLSEQSKAYMYALDANGLPYSPAWYTLDAKVLYHFTPSFSMGMNIDNITNQRYRPYSSGIAGAGRGVVVSAHVRF